MRRRNRAKSQKGTLSGLRMQRTTLLGLAQDDVAKLASPAKRRCTDSTWIVRLCIAVTLGGAVAFPLEAGRGRFFRRAARSYGSARPAAGSWGSHGATNNAHVTYTSAVRSRPAASNIVRTNNLRTNVAPRTVTGGAVVYRQPAGYYASHGAAGGTNAATTTRANAQVRLHYPSNQVITRRPASTSSSRIVSKPVIPAIRPAVIPSAPVQSRSATDLMIAQPTKQSTFPSPPNSVVPPPPKARFLARAAYREDDNPQLTALAMVPFQSIARVDSRRQIVLKPLLASENVNALEPKVERQALLEPSPPRMAEQPQLNLEPTASLSSRPAKHNRLRSLKSIQVNASVRLADTPSGKQLLPSAELRPSVTSILDQKHSSSAIADDRVIVSTDSSIPNPKAGDINSRTEAAFSSVLKKRHMQEDSNGQTSNTETRQDLATRKPVRKTQTAEALRARLVLNVPERSEVYLMGRKMVTKGSKRLFNVPVGDATKLHRYRVRVRTAQGQAIESTQLIRAGQRLELTFAMNANGLAVSQPRVSSFN